MIDLTMLEEAQIIALKHLAAKQSAEQKPWVRVTPKFAELLCELSLRYLDLYRGLERHRKMHEELVQATQNKLNAVDPDQT